MKTNYNIMDKVYEIGNDIKHNAHIYGFVGLMTLSSCQPRQHTITEFSDNIGKNFVLAEKNITRHNKGNTSSNYVIEKVLEDGSRVVYTDGNNNKGLKDKHIDWVRVYTPDNKLTMIPQGAALDSANKDYQHLRDTIDVITKKEKSIVDQSTVDKYFK